MHTYIADGLTPEQLQRARDRVAAWQADGSVDPHWAAAWAELLAAPLATVAGRLRSPDPEMTQLRQSTPFAGALPNRVRWQILRAVH